MVINERISRSKYLELKFNYIFVIVGTKIAIRWASDLNANVYRADYLYYKYFPVICKCQSMSTATIWSVFLMLSWKTFWSKEFTESTVKYSCIISVFSNSHTWSQTSTTSCVGTWPSTSAVSIMPTAICLWSQWRLPSRTRLQSSAPSAWFVQKEISWKFFEQILHHFWAQQNQLTAS